MSLGRIFDIQRFSIHDGPGIRTTVFFKGCPLRCVWCGNPESISPSPSLSYQSERCIACGACLPACRPGAISRDAAQRAVIDRQRCTRCGDCVPHCDPKALEIVGRDRTADEVLTVVLRDRKYYASSGGGLTLSGGDPLFQPEFVGELLYAARVHDVHCCLETAGYAEWSVLEPLLPMVDLWLYDLKETDPERHVKFTSVSNRSILENLEKLHDAGAKIILRCPMIPQHNARPGHLDGIVAVSRRLPRLLGVELLPYYDLWRAKLRRFGLTSHLPESVKPPDRATVDSWNDYLRRCGVRLAPQSGVLPADVHQ
jgi:pyruvate formate lyase activating enzyme